MTKTCTKCGVTKRLADFKPAKANKDGRTGQCRSCLTKWFKRWAKLNPTYHRDDYQKRKASGSVRDRQLRHKFGITLEEYNAMKAAQNNRCAICGDEELPTWKKALAVDHDHETGQVRELLCGNCNNGLGKFRDDPELLIIAAMYLLKHAAVRQP